MSTHAMPLGHEALYPVQVHVEPALHARNRLTSAFRIILALPHLILVGGPLGVALTWMQGSERDGGSDWAAGGGVLGAVAVIVALIAWFAILFTGRYPEGLWHLVSYYLRWRVRASAYVALLRDEYPPFGDGTYPATLELQPPIGERDRVSVAFRIILAIPHVIAVWALSIAWFVTTVVAWFAILFTGNYPESLYQFGVGVLRWNMRVDAYLLLMRDEYPPFSLA